METVILKIDKSIIEDLKQFISKYDNEKISIVSSQEQFEIDKLELQNELNLYEEGKSETYNLQQLDAILENIIKQYEN